MSIEERIYLEVVKDEYGCLRLADRKTGKYVAFQQEFEAMVNVYQNVEDVQAITCTVLVDDRMITDDIKKDISQ